MTSIGMNLLRRIQLWFPGSFSAFRLIKKENKRLMQLVIKQCDEIEGLQKRSAADTELLDIMHRHIRLLEDRGEEREALIAELKNQCRELGERLSGLLPSK